MTKIPNQQIQAMQALSQDLYRVAMGRNRNQIEMAERFTQEAKLRLSEIPAFEYKERILASLDSTEERSAEDLLMYSTLVRNRSL